MSIVTNNKRRKLLKYFIWSEIKYLIKNNIQYFDKLGKQTWNLEYVFSQIEISNFELLSVRWSTPQTKKDHHTILIQFPLNPCDDLWDDLKLRNHWIKENAIGNYNMFKNFNFKSGITINYGNIDVRNYNNIYIELSILIPENKVLELERHKKLEKLLC